MSRELLLEVLYESPTAALSELTPPLERSYGSGLGFVGPAVYTNFVASLDGSVALPKIQQSNKLISDRSEADGFVMGLLRAFADVIVVGSGTLRGSPTGTWSPARPHPGSASLFAELRRLRGAPERPELAILTGSGAIDVRGETPSVQPIPWSVAVSRTSAQASSAAAAGSSCGARRRRRRAVRTAAGAASATARSPSTTRVTGTHDPPRSGASPAAPVSALPGAGDGAPVGSAVGSADGSGAPWGSTEPSANDGGV